MKNAENREEMKRREGEKGCVSVDARLCIRRLSEVASSLLHAKDCK